MQTETLTVAAGRRNDLFYLGVLLLVYLIVWIPRLTGPINFRWDASTYYMLGTALAEGKGYRLLNEPGEIQAVQYPPLLPMIVAAHQSIMGTSDYFKVGSVLRLTYFVISGLFLVMTYVLARKLLSPVFALLVGVITALSFSSFLGPSNVLYADLPFAAAAIGFLLCQQKSNRAIFSIAAGILAAAAYLLRTAGLALLLAWIGESLIRGCFRQAGGRAVIAAVVVLFWQGYVWKVTHSYAYRHPIYSYQRADYNYPNVTYGQNSRLVDPFRPELGQISLKDVSERLTSNVTAVPVALGESAVVPTWFGPSLVEQLRRNLHVSFSDDARNLLIGALRFGLFIVGILALIGAGLVARSRQWVLSLYFGITLLTIVVTPWQNQFWRYLAPVAPLTLIFLFMTFLALRAWIRRQNLRWRRPLELLVIAIPAIMILSLQTAVAGHLFRSRTPISYYDAAGYERVLKIYDYGSEWHAFDPALEWIRRKAKTATVIATTVPHLAYLRTGHQAVLPPFETSPGTATHLLDEVPVTYLILDTLGHPGISERYSAPLVAHRPEDWRLVFTAPDSMTCVYERAR